MTKYVYNRDNGAGAMKFHVEIPYKEEVYLFGVQEVNNVKEIGIYKGRIVSEKHRENDGKESVEIDNKKNPPQEVIDMAIRRGVPKNILTLYKK